jgi:hypothetical protein
VLFLLLPGVLVAAAFSAILAAFGDRNDGSAHSGSGKRDSAHRSLDGDALALVQVRVLRLSLSQDWDVGVGAFPEGEEILVGNPGPGQGDEFVLTSVHDVSGKSVVEREVWSSIATNSFVDTLYVGMAPDKLKRSMTLTAQRVAKHKE